MTRSRLREDVRLVRLDRRLATPLFRQVYQRIRDVILDGTLSPGVSLPSSRSLAAQLSTARGTIELAYTLLAGEDYILGRRASGTVVNPRLRHLLTPGGGHEPRRKFKEPGYAPSHRTLVRPFQMGLPPLDPFPRNLCPRLVAPRPRTLSQIPLFSQDPAGYAPLRHAIAGYLAIARGIPCSSARLFLA